MRPPCTHSRAMHEVRCTLGVVARLMPSSSSYLSETMRPAHFMWLSKGNIERVLSFLMRCPNLAFIYVHVLQYKKRSEGKSLDLQYFIVKFSFQQGAMNFCKSRPDSEKKILSITHVPELRLYERGLKSNL